MAKQTSSFAGGYAEQQIDQSIGFGWKPPVRPGTTTVLDDGGMAIYVVAKENITQYSAVSIGENFSIRMLETSIAANNRSFAVAQVSLQSGQYGWVTRGGRFAVRLAVNCAAGAQLYTTSTAGVLDDAVVSNGIIFGCFAITSISTATVATAMAHNPHIGTIG